MKFRFCGDGDCPDWVLAEIIDTLSVMDVDKLAEIAELVAKKILGQGFNEMAVKSLAKSMSMDNTKTMVSCLHFLISNAARFNTSEKVFNEEIQQLGLPRTHAEAISGVLSKYSERIRQHLIGKAVSVNELIKVVHCRSPVKSAMSSSSRLISAKNYNRFCFHLLPSSSIEFQTKYTINIDNQHLRALLDELKYIRKIMNEYEISSKFT